MNKLTWRHLKNKVTFASIALLVLALNAQMAQGSNQKKSEGFGQTPVVTPPPASMHLDHFYKKYLDANGIAITASWRVPDSAMVQAWKEIKFMTNNLPANVLNAMVKVKTRVTVMALFQAKSKPKWSIGLSTRRNIAACTF